MSSQKSLLEIRELCYDIPSIDDPSHLEYVNVNTTLFQHDHKVMGYANPLPKTEKNKIKKKAFY